MPGMKIEYQTISKRLEFTADNMFRLSAGACALETNRGRLRPLVDDGARYGVRNVLKIQRIGARAVKFRQSLKNLDREMLRLSEICMFAGRLELAGSGWRVMHGELFRRECYFNDYTYRTDGLLAPMPQTEGVFGMSEDTPFPGIIFTHPERGTLLMGVLSQERCKPCWQLKRAGRASLLTAGERFAGIPFIPVPHDRELHLEQWVVLVNPGGVEDAVDDYFKLLRRLIRFPGATSVLRRAVVWGSWNYNPRPRGHWDITHDWVAANARALKRLAPDKPRFVMIDDGWQYGRAGIDKNWYSHCMDTFYDRGQPPHDTALFPRGMRAIADDIRRAGCGPAMWLTPRVHREFSLARERPDWLLQLEGGGSFGGRSAFLDYSVPEVREYIRRAWRTVLGEWGFRGIKLDFWTMPYEIQHVRFRNREHTAVELRNMFLRDLRAYVPDDGYLITCVCVNRGNPFLGRYADASRMSSDIGNGTWDLICHSARGLTSTTPYYRHDALLGDPDSIGWLPRNTAGENRIWATMALLSGALCEIGGDLTKLPAAGRDFLRTVTKNFGPARRTLNFVADGGLDNLPSQRIVCERELDTMAAVLNWSDERREVALAGKVRDIWTGRTLSGKVMIPPHDALWYKL